MRNRIGVLIETHSWKDYATRVRMTHDAIIAMMQSAAAHGVEWLQAADLADQHSKNRGGQQVALTYDNTEHTRTLDFRGYRYTRDPSAISGALVTRYDDQHPALWHIPLFDEVRPKVSVVAPKGGYIIPAASTWLKDKLDLHAIEYRMIDVSSRLPVQTFRARKFSTASSTFEGHSMLNVEGTWQNESRDIPAGSLFVPIAQARSRLAMALLEPLDPDSFLSWGFFNAYFEHKEYMEAYVNEEVARQMLEKDPALKDEFTKRLASDPESRAIPKRA